MAQYNFRLFLKPTVIGQAIIDRLSPEGADRQALARRWIELGYALEQAGFRLDGTTVFQGGRQVSFDTSVAVPVPAQWLAPPAADMAQRSPDPAAASTVTPTTVPATIIPPVASGITAVPATASAATAAAAPVPVPAPPVIRPPVVRPAPAVDEMTNNLRKLSL
jgi:hypothetical protein